MNYVNAEVLNATKDWFLSLENDNAKYAVTLMSFTKDQIKIEIGLRYFRNRLTVKVNKKTPKYSHVSPSIYGFMEISADRTLHYHLVIDPKRRFTSVERFSDVVGQILPKCRYFKSEDYKVKEYTSEGWIHYAAKRRTSGGETNKEPVVFI